MSKSSWQDQLAQPVRVMQFIVFALTFGCVIFAAIVIWLQMEGGPAANGAPGAQADEPFLTYVALAAIFPALIAYFISRKTLNVQARRAASASLENQAEPLAGASATEDILQSGEIARALVPIFQTRLIISTAILEGVTFFLLVVYMLEGNPLALVAGFCLVLGMASHFPTSSSVAGWIEQQVDTIRSDRQFSQR